MAGRCRGCGDGGDGGEVECWEFVCFGGECGRHEPVPDDGRVASVAYLVFNTILNLTMQAEQVACFRNAAAHLEPGGCFVIEVGVPELQRLSPGETIRALHVSETRCGLDEYDVAPKGLPDGTACRNQAARALERVDSAAVQER